MLIFDMLNQLKMKRFLILIGLLVLVTCQPAPKQAEFVGQVSLGPRDSADYTAEEIIGRIPGGCFAARLRRRRPLLEHYGSPRLPHCLPGEIA